MRICWEQIRRTRRMRNDGKGGGVLRSPPPIKLIRKTSEKSSAKFQFTRVIYTTRGKGGTTVEKFRSRGGRGDLREKHPSSAVFETDLLPPFVKYYPLRTTFIRVTGETWKPTPIHRTLRCIIHSVCKIHISKGRPFPRKRGNVCRRCWRFNVSHTQTSESQKSTSYLAAAAQPPKLRNDSSHHGEDMHRPISARKLNETLMVLFGGLFD